MLQLVKENKFSHGRLKDSGVMVGCIRGKGVFLNGTELSLNSVISAEA